MWQDIYRRSINIWSLVSSRFYMSATILLRLAVSFVTFTLLARSLGPSEFGIYASALAYAALIGLVSDFGLPLKVLRDVGADREHAASILAEALWIKGAIALVLLAIAMVVAHHAFRGLQVFAVILLLVGTAIGTVGDLIMATFRGLGQFHRETRIVTWTSFVQAGFIAFVCLMNFGMVYAAAAYCIARLLYCAVAVMSVTSQVGQLPLSANFRSLIARAKASVTFAVDSVLGNLSTQLDVILVAHILGATVAGIYQAGGRPLQIALGLSGVPLNVHLPKLSGMIASGDPKAGQFMRRMVIEWAAIGAIGAISFVVIGPIYVRLLLGSAYTSLNALWPGFAALVFVRYLVGPFGVILMVRNEMKFRIAGQALASIVFAAAVGVWSKGMGLTSVPWFGVLGTVAMLILYLFGVRAQKTGALGKS